MNVSPPFQIVFVATALLITADRLPAPILEESPTPKAEEVPRPRAKAPRKPKPKAESLSANIPQPTPQKSPAYAGRWVGVVNWGLIGGVREHTVVIDPAQTRVNITRISSGANWPASVGENGISWVTGLFGEHKWTLKPNPDGKTALVTMNDKSVIFRRVQ